MSLAPSLPPGTPMLAPDVFAGRVALITQPGDVIGAAIAAELARGGARIVLADNKAEGCATAAAAVAEVGGSARTVSVRLSDAEAVKRAFDDIERELGPVTILINNVPDRADIPVELMAVDRWRDTTQAVLDVTFTCTRELGLRRIADGQSAVIVNSGTPYNITGGAGAADITAAKSAIMNLTTSLAVEWAPYDIRVNGIAAGYVEGAEAGPAPESELGATTPAGRLGSPHEVAWCVAYMCSPYAAYLSGATIVVDGASWQRPGRSPPLFEPIRARYEKAVAKA